MQYDFRNEEVRTRFQVQAPGGEPIQDVLVADAFEGKLLEQRLGDHGELEECTVTRDFDVVDLMHGTVAASFRR